MKGESLDMKGRGRKSVSSPYQAGIFVTRMPFRHIIEPPVLFLDPQKEYKINFRVMINVVVFLADVDVLRTEVRIWFKV